MGVTIHYRGKLSPDHSIDEVIDHLKNLCFEQELECWTRDDEVTAENYLAKEDIGAQIKGIEINVHPDCETLSFTFDTKTRQLCDIWEQIGTGKKFTCGKDRWSADHKGKHKVKGSLFCKTQFAGAYAHIVVCRLLRELKDKFIPRLYVSDEGEYWQTGDIEKLKKNIGSLGEMIKALGETMKGIASQKGMTVETGYDHTGKTKLSGN